MPKKKPTCTCPYPIDRKHGVAVVIEYLKQIEDGRPVAKAGPFREAAMRPDSKIPNALDPHPGLPMVRHQREFIRFASVLRGTETA